MQSTVVFFGTDEFAATILQSLIDTKKYTLICVVTQPDRPVGRKQELVATPVKKCALQNNILVATPPTLKSSDNQNLVPSADLYIVCVYGLIIPEAVLQKSKNGSLNVHPSNLPKYRGPTPVQSAILNGETSITVSIMLLDAEMDHGPVLTQKEFSISPYETYGEVMSRLAKPAGELLVSVIPEYLNKSLIPKPQDDSAATYCKMFTRDDGRVQWQNSAIQIYNQFRATTPWPGIWTTWNGKRLKLLKISPTIVPGKPGHVTTDHNKISIGTNEHSVEVHELQLEGSKPMDAKTFLSGHADFASAIME